MTARKLEGNTPGTTEMTQAAAATTAKLYGQADSGSRRQKILWARINNRDKSLNNMSQISHVIDSDLVGVWCSHEGEISQVQYRGEIVEGSPSVHAVDAYDNEQAEVTEVRWDSKTRELLFTCYWSSTGRLAKCRFAHAGKNTVRFMYQYTDHELLVRSDA
jgi:hypothetical protein